MIGRREFVAGIGSAAAWPMVAPGKAAGLGVDFGAVAAGRVLRRWAAGHERPARPGGGRGAAGGSYARYTAPAIAGRSGR
jgi:hypothetical protein